jgi:uncharacterized protein (TIGR04255 family)
VAFPETPRVVYDNNTLEEVKCQVRFPPILAIEASPPAEFQEAVRSALPFFEVRTSVKLPSGMPNAITQIIERDLSQVGGKSYVFTSEDRFWSLTLTKDGISLNCRRYSRWEPFRERLLSVLGSLAKIYRPSFFTHTCVRYKNSIRRNPLGLGDTPWSDLLQPWASGLLSKAEVRAEVEALQCRHMIRLPDGAGRIESIFSLGVHQPTKETAFIVEAHVYDDSRKELNDVSPCLDALHDHAGSFFRWCITDRLHGAMRPNPI